MFIGSEILVPDLVWQVLGGLLDPFESRWERERLALAYESLVISKNIMNGILSYLVLRFAILTLSKGRYDETFAGEDA